MPVQPNFGKMGFLSLYQEDPIHWATLVNMMLSRSRNEYGCPDFSPGRSKSSNIIRTLGFYAGTCYDYGRRQVLLT